MCQLHSLTWLGIVFALVHLGLRAFIYAQLSSSHHTTFQWGSGLFFDWNTRTPILLFFSHYCRFAAVVGNIILLHRLI